MNPIILATSWTSTFLAGFGVTAAVLIVGGIVLLRFQRNRHEFALAKAALERGITSLPQGQPFWLVSFRQGLMSLTLGVALLIVGGAAWALARQVPVPEAPTTLPAVAAVMPEAAPAGRAERSGRIHPEPRPFNPAKERWDDARRQQSAGEIMVAAGLVLLLLGVVRMGFARVEKAQAARLIE